MKRVLIFVFSLLALASAQAQDFKPFKVNASLGYAQPTVSGATGGFLLAVEPRYGITDQIELGVRFEGAFVVNALTLKDNNGDAEVKLLGSSLLTGNYFFSTKTFRPYVGAGAGVYRIEGGRGTFINGQAYNDYDFETQNKFGYLLRAGFKAGHFNLSLEYNGVANSSVQVTQGSFEGKNSYFSIKAGIDIGGGRR